MESLMLLPSNTDQTPHQSSPKSMCSSIFDPTQVHVSKTIVANWLAMGYCIVSNYGLGKGAPQDQDQCSSMCIGELCSAKC